MFYVRKMFCRATSVRIVRRVCVGLEIGKMSRDRRDDDVTVGEVRGGVWSIERSRLYCEGKGRRDGNGSESRKEKEIIIYRK